MFAGTESESQSIALGLNPLRTTGQFLRVHSLGHQQNAITRHPPDLLQILNDFLHILGLVDDKL